MWQDNIISKKVYTIDNKGLGKVIRISGSANSILISKKPHITIQIKKLFLGKCFLEVELSKITKISSNKLWISLSKKEVNIKIKQYFSERNQKGKIAKIESQQCHALDEAITNQNLKILLIK